MLIFFGTRSVEVLNEKIEEKCGKCETENSLHASVHQVFFHVFWAPCLPIEKTGVIYCTSCNAIVPQERLIPHYKNLYLEVQKKARAPWWSFLGPMLLVLMIIAGIIGGSISDSYSADYILDPKKKDLYEVRLDDGNYTLYLVKDVSTDSVDFFIHEYQTDALSGLEQLKSKRFALDVYTMSKKELKKMFDEGDIMDVTRARWQ